MSNTFHNLHDSRSGQARTITLVGSGVNLLLSLGKLVAGILGSSAAMVADSVHSVSDFATDLVVLTTLKIASKPQDDNHNYGHGKFETLGTLVIGVSLFFVGAGLFFSGIQSIFQASRGIALPKPRTIALVAAIVSILAKEILYHYTLAAGRKINSPTIEANAWHHRSDALSSVAALFGIGGAMILGDEFAVLDPLAGVGVSFIICWVGVKVLRECLHQLAEASVDPEIRQKILNVALGIDGIEDPHNLRARWVGNQLALDLHIRVRGSMSVDEGHGLATVLEQELRGAFGEGTMTSIHVEPVKFP